MGAELEDAFRRAGADVSGGANSFDTSGSHAASGKSGDSGQRPGRGFVDAIFSCCKPSIAAINGPAVGVGLTMTLPMD